MSPGMRWNGRAIQYLYFVSQHEMNASANAMLRKACARADVARSRPDASMRSFRSSFQIVGGERSAHLWTIAICSGVRFRERS
ncbi:MAG: hypothetical protein E6K77_04835 [Candidatus Eisenbacteria bacterium]|uniref:Uncharacterized protein n=1 Tax=Eiseniibacteriota bacterium TaxID=2212470 RepID=A0A538TJ54_UNCEI|nr:MAG: hypothetical protein E6K77_04835 [Candidatus Eisenbacteria bacterium]